MGLSGWLGIIEGICPSMPAIGTSKQRKKAIELDFGRAGAKINAGKYMGFGVLASFAFSLIVSIAAYFALSLESLLALPAVFLIIFALAFFAFLNLPRLAFESSRMAMEADLPLAIRHAAIAISIRLPFEKVIEEIADAGYGCSGAFARAKNSVSSGQTVQAALLGEAAESGSRKLTRFASTIISLYEEGGEPAPLYMLADEYSRSNIAGLKEFAQKAVFGGLVFVAAACIVPAFYMIYGIISSAMQMGIEPPTTLAAWSAFLVIFPLIDLAILAFVSIGIPPSVNMRKGMAGKKKEKNPGISIASVKLSQGQVTIMSGLGFVAFAVLGFANSLFFGFAVLALAMPLAAGMLSELENEKKTEQLESGIGDALVMASSAPKGAPIEKIAATIASYASGPVAEEFATVKNQISSGVSPKTALSNIAERTDSLLVHRCISLMLLGYKGGADMRSALRKVAEDVYLAFDQVRERKNAIAMQKYTLLAGSAILVPLVMGISMGMSKALGEGTASSARVDMAGPAAAYMLIFAALAAFYCAVLEGSPKKAVTYFIASAPLALVVLILSSGAVG